MKEEENIPSLFLLIQGLNSTEKSYYKKLSKRHADHNTSLHLKLFKLIDESKIYDEEHLCRSLKISKIHFSGLKKYLYIDILDSIVFEKRNTTTETQLHFLQEQIRILIEKRLFSLAQKLCKKAIELAENFGKYHYLIPLYHLQAQAMELSDYKQYQSKTDTIFASIQAAIFQQDLLAKNKFLYNKIKVQTQYSWLRIETEEIAEIINLKKVINTIKPGTNNEPLTSLYHFNALALCEYMLHENALCTISCTLILSLWKKFPCLINEYPVLFFNSLNTTCYNNFLCKTITDQKENIMAYSTLMESYLKNNFYRKHYEIIQFNTELKIHHKGAQYVEVKILIDNKAKNILSTTAELMSSPDRLSLMCSICISYFVLEEWNQAEELLMLVKELNHDINREDILYFSSVFYLLILYEKQEWHRLDYAIEAAYHYLYIRKTFRPFERKLILFLKKLFATPSKKTGILLKQFLEQLDKDNALDKQLNFYYFNYYGWLESKLLGIRYMDYNRNKASANAAISE
ncbi:MAG TPA: hypothetical protein VIJ75_09235 [Hanamia sp.]